MSEPNAAEIEYEAEVARITQQQADNARKRRRYGSEDRPDDIPDDVSDEFWPSRRQYAEWWPFIDPGLGVDPYGSWYGNCPIAGPSTTTAASAMFNFHSGAMRCLHEPSCHDGKRGMTLNDVARMRRNNVNATVA